MFDCSNLILDYMNTINKVLSKDKSEHNLSNYTINIGHYPIDRKYTEFFLDEEYSG